MSIVDGRERTAAARAARTRKKHDRWAAELGQAGRSVVEAGHIAVSALADYNENRALALDCLRCKAEVATWEDAMSGEVPLPAVLAAVNGHTCEVRS